MELNLLRNLNTSKDLKKQVLYFEICTSTSEI